MLAVMDRDIGENFETWHNKVNSGETVIVSSPKKENVIIISEKKYKEMLKAKRNAEYLAKLDEGFAAMEKGIGITKTMEELRAMENE